MWVSHRCPHMWIFHACCCFHYSLLCACACVCLWATAALFINTSAGLTVHSGREREPWDSLRQRSHKKSLLIYFPPNWKVHAHTWLNHHASTGDGPPLHADETWSQFYRSGQSQACQGNTASRRIHTQFLMAFADVLFLIAPLALIPSSLYLTAHLIWPTLAIKPITIFFICGLRSLHVTSCFLPPSPVQPFASLYDSTSLFFTSLLPTLSHITLYQFKAWAKDSCRPTSHSKWLPFDFSLCPFLIMNLTTSFLLSKIDCLCSNMAAINLTLLKQQGWRGRGHGNMCMHLGLWHIMCFYASIHWCNPTGESRVQRVK